jgi:Na+/proline symporter
MIGASLSGVTFISVPGWVGTSHFAYMQMVLGYLLGYFVIANVLMPMYYRMNLTSIYTYLNSRFGFWSYKSGASFFLISRVVGASFRLLLVANVLQFTVFNAWNVPFWATVTITIALIWLYTFRGGIRTIIWTDTLQTIFMLTAVILCSYFIMKDLGLGFEEMVKTIDNSELSRIFYFDNWKDEHHFVKQFLSGAFITIVMTGLDQDMMQKNLSCRNIHEAKKNMYWFSIVLVPVNLLFLSLGVMLYFYAAKMGISLPERSDNLFPLIATGGYLQPVIAVFFIIGLVAAAYSSADSALTALTTSFTVDILNTRDMLEEDLKKLRQKVHVGISLMILIVILIFRAINDQSIIAAVFTFAGYTYGPLLGLYAFGLFTKRMPTDKWVPWISVAAPVIGAILSFQSKDWFNGYEFGFEILIVNGLITFMGLWAISSRGNQ